MAKIDRQDLRNLAIDLYHGNQMVFSKKEANNLLRDYIKNEICGGTFDIYSFNENKQKVFRLMSELLTATTSELSRDMFEPIAQFKDTELGDRIDFEVENPDLYEVSIIASGTNDLLRQKLFNEKVVTKGFDLGVKIYEEFNDFITGRTDWDKLVEKVGKSFNQAVFEIIAEEWEKAYTSIAGDLKVSGALDETKLVELIAKIEGICKCKVSIYGSKSALAKIPSIETFEINAKEDRENGYVSMFKGTECVKLENSYDKESKKWAIKNDKLFILPSETKPLLVGFEGDAFVTDDTTGERPDRQIEFLMTRKVHIAVIKSLVYGVYDITV